MYIFAGSYERFIFGFTANADCSQPQEVVKRYTFAAHKGAVKCLVAAGPYVASGGADDLIHLYDMKAERDLGVLMNPSDGAVPCLDFYTPEGRSVPSHMLSGSADGAINIWRCRDWQHLLVMRGHKGAVNSIAVHRSGRLALSVARDRHIRMWNLAKGRVTYVAPLEAEADDVAFLPSGESYSLTCGSKITVHSTSGAGGLVATYTAPRRILCTACQEDGLMLLGLEDGSVALWDVRTSGVVGGWARAHDSRVRGMAVLQRGPGAVPASLATASSDGTIKLWDTRRLGGGGPGGGGAGGAPAAPPCTAQISTKARLTCLAAVDPDALAPTSASGRGPTPAAAKAAGKPRAEAAITGKAGNDKQRAVQQQKQQQQPQQQPQQQAKSQKQLPKQQKAPAQPPKQPKQQKGPSGAQAGRGQKGWDEPDFEIVPAEYDNDHGVDDVDDDDEEDEDEGAERLMADSDEGPSGSDGGGSADEEDTGPRVNGRRGPAAGRQAGAKRGMREVVEEEEDEDEDEESDHDEEEEEVVRPVSRGQRGRGTERGAPRVRGAGRPGPSGRQGHSQKVRQGGQQQQQRPGGGGRGGGRGGGGGGGAGQRDRVPEQREAKRAKVEGGGRGGGRGRGPGRGSPKGRGGGRGPGAGARWAGKPGSGTTRHSGDKKGGKGHA